jgi:hypothetical protein
VPHTGGLTRLRRLEEVSSLLVDWCVINIFKVWAQNSPIFSEFRLKMLTRILDRLMGSQLGRCRQAGGSTLQAAGSCLFLFPGLSFAEKVVIFATGCFCLECLEGRFRGGVRVPRGISTSIVRGDLSCWGFAMGDAKQSLATSSPCSVCVPIAR